MDNNESLVKAVQELVEHGTDDLPIPATHLREPEDALLTTRTDEEFIRLANIGRRILNQRTRDQ